MRPGVRAWFGLTLAAVVLLATAGRGPVAPFIQAAPACQAHDGLQDSACTPGAVLTTEADTVCARGYARTVRNVPEAVKAQVFAAYGITEHPPGAYEVDHLISLELGGSNELSNLWPEAAEPRPGFHEKDAVENYLHRLVCADELALTDAQDQIRTNWLAVYAEMQQAEGR